LVILRPGPIADLGSNSLRRLNKDQLDPLLDLIDESNPCLREHLGSLTELLSGLIEHDRLPPHKLQLQLLSRDQLESLQSKDWSLKELIGPCTQCEGEAPDSCTSSNECPINDGFSPQFEGEAPGLGTSSNVCLINDDCLIREDWSTYLDLPPDLSLSAQLTPSPPASPSLLCSTEAAVLDAYRMLPTQICTQDSLTQSTSYIPNTTDINGPSQESYLDLLFLSSPIVLHPYLHAV